VAAAALEFANHHRPTQTDPGGHRPRLRGRLVASSHGPNHRRKARIENGITCCRSVDLHSFRISERSCARTAALVSPRGDVPEKAKAKPGAALRAALLERKNETLHLTLAFRTLIGGMQFPFRSHYSLCQRPATVEKTTSYKNKGKSKDVPTF